MFSQIVYLSTTNNCDKEREYLFKPCLHFHSQINNAICISTLLIIIGSGFQCRRHIRHQYASGNFNNIIIMLFYFYIDFQQFSDTLSTNFTKQPQNVCQRGFKYSNNISIPTLRNIRNRQVDLFKKGDRLLLSTYEVFKF